MFNKIYLLFSLFLLINSVANAEITLNFDTDVTAQGEEVPQQMIPSTIEGTWRERGARCSSEDEPYSIENMVETRRFHQTLTISGNTYRLLSPFSKSGIEGVIDGDRLQASNNEQHIAINNYYQCMNDTNWDLEAAGQLTFHQNGSIEAQTNNQEHCKYWGLDSYAYPLQQSFTRAGLHNSHLHMRVISTGCPGGYMDHIYSAPLFM